MDRLEAFLRQELGAHSFDLPEQAARRLALPLAVVEKRIRELVQQGEFEERTSASQRELVWKPVLRAGLAMGLQEDRIWRESVAPRLAGCPENVLRILHYATTEMLNNVFDHSGAQEVVIVVRRLSEEVEIDVEDDGIGIFNKLQRDRGLEDARHVALELSKGKLTTDPSAHTGEGIFFTSRM